MRAWMGFFFVDIRGINTALLPPSDQEKITTIKKCTVLAPVLWWIIFWSSFHVPEQPHPQKQMIKNTFRIPSEIKIHFINIYHFQTLITKTITAPGLLKFKFWMKASLFYFVMPSSFSPLFQTSWHPEPIFNRLLWYVLHIKTTTSVVL